MRLDSTIIPIPELTYNQKTAMLALMRRYYVNVDEVQFHADLAEKDKAILLYEGIILRGFSTQKIFEHEAAGRRVRIVFSGDTIVEKTHWGSFALPTAWGRLILSILDQPSEQDLYWVLISKGYKTYRFLPVFFREYYPCPVQEPPEFERMLVESLCLERWPKRFDQQRWVLRAGPEDQALRLGVADITEERRRDEHVAFFDRVNPGHIRGDELVCIARCHEDNFLPFMYTRVRRLIC